MSDSTHRTRIAAGGRVVIPAAYRRALNLEPGDEVILILRDGEVRIVTTSGAVRRARELVRRHLKPGRRLSEELLAERREETRDD